jgi:hypothetical protein
VLLLLLLLLLLVVLLMVLLSVLCTMLRKLELSVPLSLSPLLFAVGCGCAVPAYTASIHAAHGFSCRTATAQKAFTRPAGGRL